MNLRPPSIFNGWWDIPFFDIWMDKLLFFGPQGEFEENLRKFLIVVGRLEDGLKELLEKCPPQEPNSD
jgi:hypothetical protein